MRTKSLVVIYTKFRLVHDAVCRLYGDYQLDIVSFYDWVFKLNNAAVWIESPSESGEWPLYYFYKLRIDCAFMRLATLNVAFLTEFNGWACKNIGAKFKWLLTKLSKLLLYYSIGDKERDIGQPDSHDLTDLALVHICMKSCIFVWRLVHAKYYKWDQNMILFGYQKGTGL